LFRRPLEAVSESVLCDKYIAKAKSDAFLDEIASVLSM
jgi:hypothetical protein